MEQKRSDAALRDVTITLKRGECVSPMAQQGSVNVAALRGVTT
jgi:hypothetical protein